MIKIANTCGIKIKIVFSYLQAVYAVFLCVTLVAECLKGSEAKKKYLLYFPLLSYRCNMTIYSNLGGEIFQALASHLLITYTFHLKVHFKK